MTNKLVLRTVIDLMADYVPLYNPLYPLLLGNSQSYTEEVGKIDFRRLNAVGDIRAHHQLPKDTDIRQISVTETSKIFKKYFLANQFTQSTLQDLSQNEDVVKQVLDEHQRQMDSLVLFGDGSASNNVFNNGLFWSADPNWVENSSATVDGTSGKDPLISLMAKVMATVRTADLISGRKVLIFYGADILTQYDGVYAVSALPFKQVLSQVLADRPYSVTYMPPDVTPANSFGWIIVNLDQVKMHYTALPQLKAQGVNDEKMYAWHNFMMGSAMIDVKALNAVIKQPATVSIS